MDEFFLIINSLYVGYDYVTMSLRITPAYDGSGLLVNETWKPPVITSLTQFVHQMKLHGGLEAQKKANFPTNLLQHHSLREIQIIRISMELIKERQVFLS